MCHSSPQSYQATALFLPRWCAKDMVFDLSESKKSRISTVTTYILDSEELFLVD